MAEKIVVDAGHNGLTDPGAVYNGRRESDDVLRLAMEVGEILSRNGYDVEYTRTGDINQSVVQKAQFANNAGADLFISLHRNKASYPGQYDGVQTLIYDRSGFKPLMAENINENLEGLGFRNINVDLRTDLAVLRRTQMPALLVEVGFIDSEKDNQIFDTQLPAIAQAIADGIMDTLNAQTADADPVSGQNMDSMAETMSIQPRAYAAVEPVPMTPFSGNGWNSFKETPASSISDSTRPLYRVQVGAFYNLQNAIELEQELKRLGYNTWIVTV